MDGPEKAIDRLDSRLFQILLGVLTASGAAIAALIVELVK
jgi:hypothetical protein